MALPAILIASILDALAAAGRVPLLRRLYVKAGFRGRESYMHAKDSTRCTLDGLGPAPPSGAYAVKVSIMVRILHVLASLGCVHIILAMLHTNDEATKRAYRICIRTHRKFRSVMYGRTGTVRSRRQRQKGE